MKKMVFEFETDEGIEIETMWVSEAADSRYKLENIPFYAAGVSSEDIIEGTHGDDGRLYFSKAIQEGGHSTIRIYVFDAERVPEVCTKFTDLGCSFEGSDQEKLIAIDIPPEVNWSQIEALLQPLAELEIIDWEGAHISRHHVPQQ